MQQETHPFSRTPPHSGIHFSLFFPFNLTDREWESEDSMDKLRNLKRTKCFRLTKLKKEDNRKRKIYMLRKKREEFRERIPQQLATRVHFSNYATPFKEFPMTIDRYLSVLFLFFSRQSIWVLYVFLREFS